MALTKKQTKQLRALANTLKPMILIGKQDITDAVVAQADDTLERRELIKGAVQDGSGLDAKEAATVLVQVIGNRFVLFRRTHRDDVERIRLVRD